MWYPSLPKVDLQKELDDLYRRLLGVGEVVKGTLPTPLSGFEVDGNNYVFDIALSGFQKEEVTVDVVKNCVRVVGKSTRYGERNYLVTIPEDAEAEKLAASLDNGMLSLSVPRKDPNSGTRRIPL